MTAASIEILPFGQLAHAALPLFNIKLPAAQLSQLDRMEDAEYRPAAHALQADAPADEYNPTGQETHAVAEEVAAYWPAKQSVHIVEAVTEAIVPALHEVQKLASDADTRPAMHKEQAFA